MNETTVVHPAQIGPPRVPLGFPFVVIAAWLCAVVVVALAREVSLVNSLVWRHYHSRYDSGAIGFFAVRFYGMGACALGMLPLGIWLARVRAPCTARRRWLHAGAVTLLVATLVPVVRTAALVSEADRFIRRPPDLRFSRLAPYARQDLVLIGWYCVLLLVPGGLGYAVGWAVRTSRERSRAERNP